MSTSRRGICRRVLNLSNKIEPHLCHTDKDLGDSVEEILKSISATSMRGLDTQRRL